jgi:hypothetical protein
VNVRPEDRHRNNVSVFTRGDAAEEFIQEIARRDVDHGTAVARRPDEVDVQLVWRQGWSSIGVPFFPS